MMADEGYATVNDEKAHHSDSAHASALGFKKGRLHGRGFVSLGSNAGLECRRLRSETWNLPVLLSGPGAPVEVSGVTTARFEIPIAVTGSWVKGSTPFSISAQDLADMVRNFTKRKNDMVVIDYEHASEMPNVAKGGPVPAAGWIHELRLESNGTEKLMALVEWTPEAEGLIRSGQYRFFSPAIDWGAIDKETGKPQGATLTSGALTNHPFLEELPPIMLSDGTILAQGSHPGRAASRDKRYFISERHAQGEKAMKKLRIQPIPEGHEHAGHHAVFEEGVEEPLGFISHDELSEYASKHLGINPDVIEDTEESLEGENSDETKNLKVAAREARRRAFFLSEAVRKGRIDNQRASELAETGKITLADYIRGQEAEKLVESAIAAGKILPRDRAFFFHDALERPKEFQEYVRNAPPVIRLGAKGIGSADPLPVDEEVHLGVKRLMSEKGLNYSKALKELLAANPSLGERYRQKHIQQMQHDVSV
jgi:phage I-like protein